jgi:hypothetical protein
MATRTVSISIATDMIAALPKMHSEGSQAGADLQNPLAGLEVGGLDNPVHNILINQEVLPKTLLGAEPTLFHDAGDIGRIRYTRHGFPLSQSDH